MNSQRRIVLTCVILSVLGGIPVTVAAGGSAAEELTKRLPDGTIAFVATSGSDALKGDFEKTILGRIWNDPGVRMFYQSIKGELLTKIGQSGDPNVTEKVNLVLDYARLAASRPILIGAAQVAVQEGPPVAGFAIVDAGSRKAELAAIVSKIEAMAGPEAVAEQELGVLQMRSLKEDDGLPLQWGWMDNHFIIAINDAQGTALKSLTRARSSAAQYLVTSPAGGDALVVYYDYPKVFQVIGSLIREEEGEAEVNLFTTALKKLGLADVRTLRARVGFAGSDLVAHSIVEVVTPASGLLVASKPVDPAWFGAVHAQAMTASAVNWDLAAVYDTIMDTLKTVSADEAHAAAQEAISGFESEAKLRIREDLLAALAGPVVSYSLPAGIMLEAPRGGFVLLARLRDAQAFERAATALGEFAAERAKNMLQITSQKRDDGRVVHGWAVAPLAMMGMMPTWSVVEDHVVVASSAELCDLGAQQFLSRGSDTKSLLNAEGYKKVAGGLPANLLGLTYIDSQVYFNQLMMQMQQVWPMLTMVAMQQGVKLPMMLPSLTSIARDMAPSCSYRYVASDGFHAVYRGPGVEASQMTVAGGALAAGIMMPALARVRQLAYRTTSAANLSAIGKACLIYANDHDDKLPPDLETLVSEVELSPKCLVSKLKPDDFDGPSYIYIAGQTMTMEPGNIVAYENPEFSTDGINVLFLDTHVEFMKPEEFRRELGETYERLGRPMPEVRFKSEKAGSRRAPGRGGSSNT